MKQETLDDLGEVGIIQLIQESVPSQPVARLKKGIGDDCAVLETAEDRILLVTTDTLVEGIHFTAATLPPEALGWKALAVNISDIAAMGGQPHTAFLSIAIDPQTESNFIASLMAGFQALAEETDVVLAGGDTVESPASTIITITLLGDCRPEHVVYRSGAQVGDDIWVTGPLGNAAAGLFLLLNRNAFGSSQYQSLIMAHQKPVPRLKMGKALAEGGLAHAMIDISDGIAKDLGHVCQQSGTGSLIRTTSIPMSEQLLRLALETEKRPLDWALHGGEDYELLFTAASADEAQIVSVTTKVSGSPAAKIGKIIPEAGIWLETEKGKEPLGPGGYMHFSR